MKKENCNVLLVDVENATVEKIELPKDSREQLNLFYEKIGCGCIDIVSRRVNGASYDIVLDDEGLFKDEIIVSAVTNSGMPALVGNLIFSKHGGCGETVGLSDDDIYNITHSLGWITNMSNRDSRGNLAVILDDM